MFNKLYKTTAMIALYPQTVVLIVLLVP